MRELFVIMLVNVIASSAVIQTAGIWLLKLFVFLSTKLQLFHICPLITITPTAPAA